MEEEIRKLIAETLETLGFEVVKVTFQGGKRKVLEVLIDRLDGEKVQVGDCSKVSKHISAILDVEDVIADKYFLEIGSSGVERPLVYLKDYTRFTGKEVKIRLKNTVRDKLTYKGQILRAEGEKIFLQHKNLELEFDFSNIKSANLVLTDEMFKELLNKKVS